MTLAAQQVSSKLAFVILQVIQLRPYLHPEDPNLISLPHFDMNVGTACSGLKLTLAILTASAFIAMVARLGWWKNLVLLGVVVPLAMIINSVRVAMVGVAGEFWGSSAGMWMHDYGSYGVMLLAFWLLYRLSLGLGWKI
jgi:exosortase